jgi:hypothetical protein
MTLLPERFREGWVARVTVVTLDIETTGKNPLVDRLLCVGIGDRVYPPEQGRAMARALMLRRGTTIAAHTNFDLRWLMIEGARSARASPITTRR